MSFVAQNSVSPMRILATLLVVCVAYYAMLYVFQRKLLFPAPRGPAPRAVPADAQRASLALPFGNVPIWYLAPLSTRDTLAPVILFAHGNGERAEDWLNAFRTPRLDGYGVVVMEYPGYGEADGAPSEATISATVLAAYDWAATRPGVDSARIVGYGRSLGGGAVASLAGHRPIHSLVLESSFASIRELAGRVLAPELLVRDPFDNRAALRRFSGPLLVIHGASDEIAPVAHGRALAAIVPGAAFIELDCGHNDCVRPWPRVLGFLNPSASRPVRTPSEAPSPLLR